MSVPSPRRVGSLKLFVRYSTLAYLAAVLVLPFTGLVVETLRAGPKAFFVALSDGAALESLQLSIGTALLMVAFNAVMGTATAWVLVRYKIPGKTLINALIDLPFAVPTIVTGLMLVVMFGPSSVVGTILRSNGWAIIYEKPGVLLALLFITYPFVIRAVQPVLHELDRAEEEAAATLGAGAFTTFFRVTLPALRPAILSGSALSFSRALGEFGSVIMVAGNKPYSTQTAPLYIYSAFESGNNQGALVVSTVLLLLSLGTLIAFSLLERKREVEIEL
jgi:sulfate/thiosulfate transport system permease protein